MQSHIKYITFTLFACSIANCSANNQNSTNIPISLSSQVLAEGESILNDLNALENITNDGQSPVNQNSVSDVHLEVSHDDKKLVTTPATTLNVQTSTETKQKSSNEVKSNIPPYETSTLTSHEKISNIQNVIKTTSTELVKSTIAPDSSKIDDEDELLGNETSIFLPEEGSAEKEHFSSLTLFFILLIIVICIFLIHFLLLVKWHYLPDSLALIFLGALIGIGMKVWTTSFHGEEKFLGLESFSPTMFFLVLLPPIIFESGYNLHKGNFFTNFGSIIVFAILGTLISTLIVCIGIYVLGLVGLVYELTFVQCFAFGSLISAVDPVATIAIFQALKVDPVLNMLVFGESILNDAVAIVLTTTAISISTSDETNSVLIFQGILKFIYTFLGSAVIGICVGLLSALLLKHIDFYKNPSLEFGLMLCFVYIPYALSEGLSLSGIMSILFCGIVMSNYTHFNLSPVTQISMQQTMRTLSFVCESCVFAYLGLAIFSFPLIMDAGLIVLAIILILIGRALNIYPLSFLCNKFRHHKITTDMMFIMWFSGLRGAVAYALSLHLEFENEEVRRVLVTTTLFVVLFTTIALGGTTLPVVKYLTYRSKGMHQRLENDEEQVASDNNRIGGVGSGSVFISRTNEMEPSRSVLENQFSSNYQLSDDQQLGVPMNDSTVASQSANLQNSHESVIRQTSASSSFATSPSSSTSSNFTNGRRVSVCFRSGGEGESGGVDQRPPMRFGRRSCFEWWNSLRGFQYYDIKYFRPFFIRRFTLLEMSEGRDHIASLTEKWIQGLQQPSSINTHETQNGGCGGTN